MTLLDVRAYLKNISWEVYNHIEGITLKTGTRLPTIDGSSSSSNSPISRYPWHRFCKAKGITSKKPS
jgi:hypothetical protein